MRLVSHDAAAIFKTTRMMVALNIFMAFPFRFLAVFQFKKLVMANTVISVMLM